MPPETTSSLPPTACSGSACTSSGEDGDTWGADADAREGREGVVADAGAGLRPLTLVTAKSRVDTSRKEVSTSAACAPTGGRMRYCTCFGGNEAGGRS